jgi:hypothetical protein
MVGWGENGHFYYPVDRALVGAVHPIWGRLPPSQMGSGMWAGPLSEVAR